MVYVIYDPEDSYWVGESNTLFASHILKQKTMAGKPNLFVAETDFVATSHIIFYTGHGGPRRGPEKMSDAAGFVSYILLSGIRVDRIVFLSCSTFPWVCNHYADFARVLQRQSKIQIEGSNDKLYMAILTPAVRNNIDTPPLERLILTVSTVPDPATNLQRFKSQDRTLANGTVVRLTASKKTFENHVF